MLQVTCEYFGTSGPAVEQVWHATHSPQGPAVKPERQHSDSFSLVATVVGTVGAVVGSFYLSCRDLVSL